MVQHPPAPRIFIPATQTDIIGHPLRCRTQEMEFSNTYIPYTEEKR